MLTLVPHFGVAVFHRRLLTDDSPRIRAALRSFLYGSDNLLKVCMAWKEEKIVAISPGCKHSPIGKSLA